MSVQGDYEATLGFTKAGDVVHIVGRSSRNGEVVADNYLDTSNQQFSLMDGVSFGFNRGFVFDMDRFDVGIGSGIGGEVDRLSNALSRVNRALAEAKTRAIRVSSIINIQGAISKMYQSSVETTLGGSFEAGDIDKLSDKVLAAQSYNSLAMNVIKRLNKLMLLSDDNF